MSTHLTANNIYIKSIYNKFFEIKAKIAQLFSKYNKIISNQLLRYINKIYSNSLILTL